MDSYSYPLRSSILLFHNFKTQVMEQSIIIPVSLGDLKQIVTEAVNQALTGTLHQFIPDEKRYLTRKEVAENSTSPSPPSTHGLTPEKYRP